jgi:cyclase
MVAKRIIACLDVKDGRTVKGTGFVNLKDMGDPVALAARYAEEGVDELVLLDITASLEGRHAFTQVVEEVAAAINIPFTVGGGISSVADAERLLEAGADKVSVNSAAFRQPGLLQDIARRYGSQCLVLAIDVKRVNDRFEVYSHGGTKPAGWELLAWAEAGVASGAGEILLTAMDSDGARNGFNLEACRLLSGLPVPVIISGGAGEAVHFADAFTVGGADAALAAGIFHEGLLPVPVLKQYLQQQNILVRI